ncbi:hypothetical protein AB8S10_04225 [Klebsiella pneumoniae]|uniref:hypothetical protein n=1 Tax=Klebsiella variicola TaxID=244366 RepID=UPI000666C5F2|nr:hypothetical protein [Klebsiella variicola]HBU8908609.1 hypothetical protein [Klebsiella pneumoniae]HDT4208552.1 hypothetical protein [Klebsiella pneumoniae subsp. pneumoniae]HDX9143263.1 hypothetical protein [Klebsiella michiganensis]HBV1165675.1 hypothetical protein [Klebsiella pneumoniae]HBV8520310.1 hypothetical protein [Klebsiella pneumoniae]
MTNERPPLLTTGSTVSAAENIVAWLKPELLNEPQQNKPDRVSVIERHIGQFSTPAEVKTYLTDRDGCIRLAALRVRNVRSQAGGTVGDVTWAAYVMATDAWGYTRDTRCEVLVGKLVRRIVQRGAANGMKAERLATSVSADNIYSGGLNDLGLTMWAVTWEQEFRLDDEIDLATLPDFLRLGVTLQVSDDTDPIKGVINVREP